MDLNAFQIQAPAGAKTLEIEFQVIGSHDADFQFGGNSRNVVSVEWTRSLLYPAAYAVSAVTVAASLKLPTDWQSASALQIQKVQDGWIEYGATSLETLLDSPVIAGRYFRRFDLDSVGARRPVTLNVVAEDASQLEASAQQVQAHRNLVQQADLLFRARHYSHYDFLLAIGDHMPWFGLEHHESSENGAKADYFKDWDKAIRERELLPHEFVHSWNGKFRRPADLWAPNLNVPTRNSLLWVYEGQTQYWGWVLAVRSGLVTAEQERDALANVAAWYAHDAGRSWRSLQDTTNESAIGSQRKKPWYDWQRGWNYYSESALLIWLDADVLIRQLSDGKKSLDDFAREFFGRDDGRIAPLLYTFDDVVAALNTIQPFDWKQFLRERLDRTQVDVALDVLNRAGWKLEFGEKESDSVKANRGPDDPQQDLRFSLGIAINKKGELTDVAWDGPGFKAGLAPAMQLLAVNTLAYTPERLAVAVTSNKDGKMPLELLIKDADQFRMIRIDVRGGLRYPRLVRIESAPDILSSILAPR